MTQTVLLGDICHYITEKTSVSEVALKDYVSTENLIAEKGGLSLASNLPQTGKVTKYQAGDVLVSNIRPYFKKIWFADCTGGASNDVLVFRPTTEEIANEYLYYVLANDKFFDYSTASSGGSKMPRGDKVQIMKYPVHLPDLETQKKIVEVLGRIDEKIELNRAMNETLEQMGQALFRHYFIDNPEAETWEERSLGDAIELLGGLSYKAAYLSGNGTGLPMVTMGCVSGKNRINLDALKYYTGDYKEQHLLHSGDMFIATRDVTQDRVLIGSPAIVPDSLKEAICATNLYQVVKKQDISTEFLYQLMRTKRYRNQIIASAKGSTIVMLTKDSVLNYTFKVNLGSDGYKSYVHEAELLRQKIDNNSEQVQTLTTLRDTLLPRLISGKMKV